MVSVVSDPVPLSLDMSGCEVLHWPWGAATKCTVAHGGHSITGAAALEGPPQRGLEGQDILPLVPAAPAPSGLHQVGPHPCQRTESLLHFGSQGEMKGSGSLGPLVCKIRTM